MSARHGNYRRVGKRPAVTADERQHSLNPVMRTQAVHDSKNKPDESWTGRPTFREDFLMEHSRFGQQADSIELAGCF
jgi:hypothetical protein